MIELSKVSCETPEGKRSMASFTLSIADRMRLLRGLVRGRLDTRIMLEHTAKGETRLYLDTCG